MGHYASENDHIVCVTRKSNIRTHGVSHTMVPSYIWLLSIWYLPPSSSWQYMFPFPCYVLKTFKLKKSLCDGLDPIGHIWCCPVSSLYYAWDKTLIVSIACTYYQSGWRCKPCGGILPIFSGFYFLVTPNRFHCQYLQTHSISLSIASLHLFRNNQSPLAALCHSIWILNSTAKFNLISPANWLYTKKGLQTERTLGMLLSYTCNICYIIYYYIKYYYISLWYYHILSFIIYDIYIIVYYLSLYKTHV